jgi:hypothetical protein
MSLQYPLSDCVYGEVTGIQENETSKLPGSDRNLFSGSDSISLFD